MIYLNNLEKTIHKPAVTDLTPVWEGKVKKLLARLFAVKNPENIFLTRSGEDAMELALRAFAGEGARIAATNLEQNDTYKILESLSAKVSCVPSDLRGRPKCEEAEPLLQAGAQAVVWTHGSRTDGNVTDLERICSMARKYRIPVIADGRLTAGAIEVNLEAIGAEVYVITGEKMLMGSRGIGAILVRDGVDTEPLRRLMAGQEPEQMALNVFAASLKFILDCGIYGFAMLPHRLAKRFYESANAMDGVTVYGDYGSGDRLPVVSITVQGFTAEEIRDYMKEQGIQIGVERGLARFSFCYCNTRPQVKETVQKLMDLLGIDDPYLLP